MRVTVDMTKCQDYGQCVFAAPEVFSLDETGSLTFTTEPDDSQRTNIEDAADVCPVQAITLAT